MSVIFHQHLLPLLEDRRISDFHLHAGKPLSFREAGEIHQIEEIVISQDALEQLLQDLTDADDWKHYQQYGDLDFAITMQGQRFRANAAHTLDGHALVLRVILSAVPDMDQLGLPSAVHACMAHKAGLVLVTGQTGSGKSTSLAAMIDRINSTRAENIITIEDPVEFIHKPKSSLVSQRQVGRHTQSFATALKAALRQDPDIILLGELRDYETISMALTAAETGHLVFGTLHTSGAPETVNRIIDSYPASEQSQARSQLSQSLRLVLTQQLLKRRGGGRIAAFEVMVTVPAVANLIRENKIFQLDSVIQTGRDAGMITMTEYCQHLAREGLLLEDIGGAD